MFKSYSETHLFPISYSYGQLISAAETYLKVLRQPVVTPDTLRPLRNCCIIIITIKLLLDNTLQI